MADFVLPSKLVGERITVTFEFRDLLDWGETIVSGETAITVSSGVDASPSDMLYRDITVSGTTLRQKVQLGEPGVIYQLEGRATGSTGQIYSKVALLAILPSHLPNPPFDGNQLTSKIYPIDDTAELQHEFLISFAKLRPQPFDEAYIQHSNVEPLVGNMYEVLVRTDAPTESIQHQFSALLGTMSGALTSFTAPEEEIQHSILVLGGSLDAALIVYFAPVESVQHSFSLLSGSLS